MLGPMHGLALEYYKPAAWPPAYSKEGQHRLRGRRVHHNEVEEVALERKPAARPKQMANASPNALCRRSLLLT